MSALHRSWLADQADAIKYQREMRELDAYANPNPASPRRHLQGHRGRSMSATDATYIPIPVSDVDIAFGGKAMEILPPMDAIPAKFHAEAA